MNNNFGYGGFPSANSSGSFSSFSSQYASTPTNNGGRFQRPRFAYAGPPSYPRPRSSASKPNPDPHGESYQNSSYDSFELSNDNMGRKTFDYDHGGMDSMRNNFGDSNLPPLNDSSALNQSGGCLNDSSAYITCNESFYESPTKPNYMNNNALFGASNQGGHSSFPNSNFQRPDTFLRQNIGRPALLDNKIGFSSSSTDSLFRGITGAYARDTRGRTLGVNTRGNRGIFSENRGNLRGHSQKRPFGRGAWRHTMGSKMVSSWKCELCSIFFTSQVPLDMHLRGTKHAKKLKTINSFKDIKEIIGDAPVKEVVKPDGKKFYCELCDVIANSSVQLQMHLDGTKHKSKLAPPAANKDESENPEIANDKNETEPNGKSNGGALRRPAPADFSEPQPMKMAKLSCDICNIFVNSDIQLQQHLISKKHQAKVEGKPIFKPRKGFGKKQEGEPLPSSGDSEAANQLLPSGDSEVPSQPLPSGDSEVPSQPLPSKGSKVPDKPQGETKTVVGVKTLAASFVKSDTLL